jgi:hypothetical protein
MDVRSKLFNIVKSRFIDGEKLPQWYEDRLEICAGCELNSKNVESKGSLSKGYESIVGAFCTSCKCPVDKKAKIEEEYCPVNKWAAIKDKENTIVSTLHTIQNLSPDKVKLEKQGTFYLLDFGTMKFGSDSRITLNVFSEGMSKITSKGSCGCLTTEIIAKERDYDFSVTYNTNLEGEIEGKTVEFLYTKSNIKTAIKFLIKGRVIR